ncbi:hypothetical protein KI387_013599 [Taxus chinensis]|uniref:Uncharacterized protein n=1 Tax=Taxus chinensis TaxID=29808 RepID=A0AA38CIN7_TAXCH|nr:hypothetical protein KI387_013599 [Taxus chinensis]
MGELGSFLRETHSNDFLNGDNTEHENLQIAHPIGENGIAEHHETRKLNKIVHLPTNFKEDDLSLGMDFTVKGKKKDDETIFSRLRIVDKEGDTTMSVASKMVAKLDLVDQDVSKIPAMIDEEILALVPNWKVGVATDDHQRFP